VIPNALDAILLVAIIANGALAGVYLAFPIAVVPALRRLDARAHVQAFVSVNRVIVNPVFLTLFAGAPTSAVIAAICPGSSPTGVVSGMVAAVSSVLAFVVTVVVNVPLNRALEEADALDDAGAVVARDRFSRRWDRANAVRTAACSVAALASGWTAVAW
jgi:uncharacterized membrane protein